MLSGVKPNRTLLIAGALAATAAVAAAQMTGYTPQTLATTAEGKSLVQVLNDLNRYYLYPIDQDKLLRGAINGALGSLEDEFTYYTEPATNEIDQQNLAGSFGGIGVTLIAANADGTGVKVDNVYKNNPAFKAGVQIGDVFLKIGDKDVSAAKSDEVVKLVRGPVGSEVSITFARGGKPFTVKLKREQVNIVSVEKAILPGNVGYIALSTFYNEQASAQFRAAVADMKKANVQKLILDLRDNGGGLLSAGVDVADQFLSTGPIVSLRERTGAPQVYGRATRQASDYTGKLVVLVNKNSASASEVVGGALQDSGRATIIGEQTFGKGVAQIPITLPDGGKVAIVNSAWLTPKGREIHKKGITPDIVVTDTRFPVPLNFTGAGATPGSKITITVGGQPVTVTADKEGKFTYIAEVKRAGRSDVQGQAVVDIANDAIVRRALEALK